MSHRAIMPTDQFKLLLSSIKRSECKAVDLSYARWERRPITLENLCALRDALGERNTAVVSLDFSHTLYGVSFDSKQEQSWDVFNQIIHRCHGLKYLDLEGMYFSQAQASTFIKWLQSPACQLQELHLKNTEFEDPEQAVKICQRVKSTKIATISLNLLCIDKTFPKRLKDALAVLNQKFGGDKLILGEQTKEKLNISDDASEVKPVVSEVASAGMFSPMARGRRHHASASIDTSSANSSPMMRGENLVIRSLSPAPDSLSPLILSPAGTPSSPPFVPSPVKDGVSLTPFKEGRSRFPQISFSLGSPSSLLSPGSASTGSSPSTSSPLSSSPGESSRFPKIINGNGSPQQDQSVRRFGRS